MLFFTAVALPSIILGVAWGLLFLPSRTTGWLVRLDVGLAWFAALATLILVPTDVGATLAGEPPGPLRVWWRAAYWYGFGAQVLVLPLHMEFTRRGEFTTRARLAAAARYNALYYALLLAVALAGLLLLLAAGRLAPDNVLGFCIASSNAYGLVAAIFLLGYGLWAVPRALWHSADRRGEQRRVCHAAGLQAERAQAARRRLSEALLAVRAASVLFAPRDPLRPLMDAVLAQAAAVGPAFQPDGGGAPPADAEPDVFDAADLARLRRRLMAAASDWEREHALFLEAVDAHLRLEAVVAALAGGDAGAGAPPLGAAARLWHARVRFLALRALAALAALASLAIALAEATIAWALPNLSAPSALLRATAGSRFGTELLCFLLLAYPCACAYYGLYRLGRFAFYRMVPRHTDPYSLCFSGLLMCRFAAPLAFNFVAAVALPETKMGAGTPDVTATVFYAEFGQLMMRQPLIGWQFTTFAPALLIPFMALLVSGVFGRLAALLWRGDDFEFEDDWLNDSYAAAGRRLLLLESENARNGLPPGLTLEPSAGGGTAADAAAPAGAASGLLGTLRSAAAAAAAEREAERRAGSWWRRLLPGGGGGGGAGDAGGVRLSPEAPSVRTRLARLAHPAGRAAGRSAAGYSELPSDAPASRPVSHGAAPGGGAGDVP